MIQVRVSTNIKMSGSIPEPLRLEIGRRLTMPNPKWLENNKYGRFNRGVPKVLKFYHRRGADFFLPRGFTGRLLEMLTDMELEYELEDKTRFLAKREFDFCGQLRPFQEIAAQRALARRFGVVRMPTGAGKTVLALYAIHRRAQPALVVVHTKELLYQWRDRAMEFLGLDESQIGLLGDAKKQLERPLTIAIIHSLYKNAKTLRTRVGHLVVDECHHMPSKTFTHAVNLFDCKFMLGLSATPFRRDGLTRLIHLYLGDMLYSVDPKELADTGSLAKAVLHVRKTHFDYPFNEDYPQLIAALTLNRRRNTLIADDVAAFVQHNPGACALVVSDRKAHCRDLAEGIAKRGPRVKLLTGDTAGAERHEVVCSVNEGGVDVLVATLQLVGEGFDCSRLSGLFLATPIKFSGRLLQVVGRVLRTAREKGGAQVFDYVDAVGVLKASFFARKKAYSELEMSLGEPIQDQAGEGSGTCQHPK